MRIRTSEQHPTNAINTLQKREDFGELQGLAFNGETMTGLEAIQLEPGETYPNYQQAYSEQEWRHKEAFCNALNIPLHVIIQKANRFYIVHHQNQETLHRNLTTAEFLDYFQTIKNTRQHKPAYENQVTKDYTNIDNILEQNRLQWGGNIDGFIMARNQTPRYLLEIRTTREWELNEYDPLRFYHGTKVKKGDYGTFKPLMHIKEQLDIPLLLITAADKNPNQLGLQEILHISPNEVKATPRRVITPDYFDDHVY